MKMEKGSYRPNSLAEAA